MEEQKPYLINLQVNNSVGGEGGGGKTMQMLRIGTCLLYVVTNVLFLLQKFQ